MNKRETGRPQIGVKHRDIVNAQHELLKSCPNVEGVSNKDLEYVCWACGVGRDAKRRSELKLTRCHIARYQPNEAECPENYILLCDRCHREQPDAMPKEVIRYWLETRESERDYNKRIADTLLAACKLLERDFGSFAMDVGWRTLAGDGDFTNSLKSCYIRYAEQSAGAHSTNQMANGRWAVVAELHKWCVENKDAIQKAERYIEEEEKRRLKLAQTEPRDQQRTLF